MALALRLLLLLLLAVALPARAAPAAPMRARGADSQRDLDYLEVLANDGVKILENAGGPPRGKNQDIPGEDKKSLEASELLDQMLSDLERRHEMNRKALLKVALPGGSNGSMPAPDTQRVEMPKSGTGEFISDTGIYIRDPMRLPRIACPQDVRKSCMVGTVVTLITVPLVLVCCCVGIQKLYKMRKYLI